MTSPRGGGNDINLAALWIPVMPETSKLGSEMRKAGQTAKHEFEQGFNSGTSPEQLGAGFGSRLQQAIGSEFKGGKGFEFLHAGRDAMRDFDQQIAQTSQRLKGEASQALQQYQADAKRLESTMAGFIQMEQRHQAAITNGTRITQQDMRTRTQWQSALKRDYDQAQSSLDAYNGKHRELNATMGRGAEMGRVMTGVISGGITLAVLGAAKAIEGFTELVVEGFTKAIELGGELAKYTVEIGETYENIGIQIHEFSSATGEDFEKLEASAGRVLGRLDVDGKNVGQTMAQLTSILGSNAEEVEVLSAHILELQGRYSSLKATDVAAIFRAFNVPAGEADTKLASLLQSARNSGQDLGALTAALSGDSAVALHTAGMSIEQAGAFMAELLKMGQPGQAIITNLSTAIRVFKDEGLDFGEGMKIASQRLNELGDTAEGQKLAQTLFGTSRWATATQAVQTYMDVLGQGPEKYEATSGSIDEFLSATQTLENEITEFKNKAADVFRPFGDAAKNAVSQGLNSVSTWFSQHKGEVIDTIQDWGNKLIDFLPRLQEFSVITLRIMGDLANALAVIFAPLVTQMGIAGAGMLALTGNFTEARDLLAATGEFDIAAVTGKIATTVNDFADKIGDIKLDTESIRDAFNDAADSANSIPSHIGGMAGMGAFPGGVNPSVPGAPGSSAPGAFPSPVAGAPGGSTPGSTGGPGGFFGATASSGGGGSTEANKQLARQMFPWPESEWAAFDKLEMKEAGYNATADNPTSTAYGMGQFLDTTWQQYGYPATGTDDPATQLKLMYQYISERYGTPSAALAFHLSHNWYDQGGDVPPWADDPNTVRQNPLYDMGGTPGGKGRSVFAPGRLAPSSPFYDPSWGTLIARIAGGQGFAGGGGPRGTDTVPAWLTPGEYVWDTDTVKEHGWLIRALHQAPGLKGGGWAPDDLVVDPGNPIQPNMYGSLQEYLHAINLASFLQSIAPHHDSGGAIQPVHPGGFGPDDFGSLEEYRKHLMLMWQIEHISERGYAGGGFVKYFQGGGAVDDVVGTNQNIQGIDQIAKGFGLSLTAGQSGHGTHDIDGGWHDSGSAGDFSNGSDNTPEMLAFAMYMFEHYGSSLAEIIYSDPRMTKLIKDGRVVDPSFYGADTLAGHRNHVHIAARAETQMADMSPGNEQLTQGLMMPGVSMSMSPGSTPRGGGMPGVPGQYGGYGAYNAQTYDQMINAQQAVTDAQDRASDLDHQITQNQRRIDEINREIADLDVPKLGPLGRPLVKTPEEIKADEDKRRALNAQLDDATYALGTSQRERSQQDGKISEAQRKQLESYYAQPKGTKAPKATGVEAAGQFGGAFLSGVAQELGFGDILDKPPWEWGAVKLMTGLASWGLGTANAWADEIGKGHTAVTGYGAIPGYENDQGWGGGASMMSGLLGGMGINVPKPAMPSSGVSTGPNVVQTQPGPGFGQPTGPAPGPMVAGDYMPINVQAGVNPSTILAPVQEQRNAQNSNHFQFQGGFPPS